MHEFQSVENLQHTLSSSDEKTDVLITTIAFPKLHKGFQKGACDLLRMDLMMLANSASHKEED